MTSSYNNTRASFESSLSRVNTRNSSSRFRKPSPDHRGRGAVTMTFKVLIVDDEPDLEVLIRQRFRKRIRDGEFEFVFAPNGQEALTKLHNDPDLDIILS